MNEMRLSRRKVLKTGVIAGGGLIIGANLSWADEASRTPAQSSTGQLNAWIRVTPNDEVHFLVDRAEMGQGVVTSLTMLVAEEIGIDPTKIKTSFAPPGDAFGNSKLLNAQMTGGSTSVAAAWEPLRQAGARVRAMLIKAGAKALDVDEKNCVIQNFSVADTKSKRTVSFGQIANAASKLRPPHKVDLKPIEQFQFLGKQSKTRLDVEGKVRGLTEFGIDVKIPGLLSCVVIRPPVIGAKVKSFTTSVPGAKHVVEINRGVAVVADTYWRAKKAAEKIKVEWNMNEVVRVDSEKLKAEFAGLAQKSAVVAAKSPLLTSTGTMEKTFSKSEKTKEALYELPYLPHATMEPMNCTAHVESERCRIWVPTQAPAAARELASQLTGLSHDKIEVNSTFLGGGFGRRIYQDFVAEAVEVSQKVKAPIKVTWSREDDFQNDFYRPMMTHYVRAAFSNTGISHWLHRVAGQSIFSYGIDVFAKSLAPNLAPGKTVDFFGKLVGGLLQAWNPNLPWPLNKLSFVDMSSVEGVAGPVGKGLLENVPGKKHLPYAVDNFLTEYAHKETGVPVGFWRSVGHSHSAFVVESFIDEIANETNQDPYLFRLQLLEKNKSERNARVLRLAAEKAGWSSPASAGIFRGIAQHESFHSYCAMVVEVSKVGQLIKLERVVVAVDCGFVLNPDIVVAQAEGAVIFGLSAALKQAVTFKDGAAQQRNFYDCDLLRINEAPKIEVHIVPSTIDPTGIGEICVPPTAPALCNAIFKATGKRLRELPVKLV